MHSLQNERLEPEKHLLKKENNLPNLNFGFPRQFSRFSFVGKSFTSVPSRVRSPLLLANPYQKNLDESKQSFTFKKTPKFCVSIIQTKDTKVLKNIYHLDHDHDRHKKKLSDYLPGFSYQPEPNHTQICLKKLGASDYDYKLSPDQQSPNTISWIHFSRRPSTFNPPGHRGWNFHVFQTPTCKVVDVPKWSQHLESIQCPRPTAMCYPKMWDPIMADQQPRGATKPNGLTPFGNKSWIAGLI